MASYLDLSPEGKEKKYPTIHVELTPEEQEEREKYNIIPTLNGMGYMYERYYPNVNEYLRAYFENISHVEGPILDIGVAYGVTVFDALTMGATVIANDIHQPHLDIVDEIIPDEYKDRLTLHQGHFPNETNFEPRSLGAVLVSRVMNFLSGDEIEEGLEKIFYWLKPGGKVYVVAETIHKSLFQHLFPTHKKHLEYGHYWPGEIVDVHTNMPKRQNHLPKSLHFLDEAVLRRAFEKAGFVVEKCSEFSKHKIPEDAILQGNETVGIIGVKP